MANQDHLTFHSLRYGPLSELIGLSSCRRLSRVTDEEAGALTRARAHEDSIAGAGAVCHGHVCPGTDHVSQVPDEGQ